MPEQVLFVPECHVDTALARALLAGRDSFFNHQHGISKVANLLRAQAAAARGPRRRAGRASWSAWSTKTSGLPT